MEGWVEKRGMKSGGGVECDEVWRWIVRVEEGLGVGKEEGIHEFHHFSILEWRREEGREIICMI